MNRPTRNPDGPDRIEVMEEVIGVLSAIRHSPDGTAILDINDSAYIIDGILPQDIETFVGQRVAVLRMESGYHLRVLNQSHVKKTTQND